MNVETQVYGSGDLVYILASRSLGADGGDLDLAEGDGYFVSDLEHHPYFVSCVLIIAGSLIYGVLRRLLLSVVASK